LGPWFDALACGESETANVELEGDVDAAMRFLAIPLRDYDASSVATRSRRNVPRDAGRVRPTRELNRSIRQEKFPPLWTVGFALPQL